MYDNACQDALDAYDELLKQGVAPEQARGILPQATYTEWWWTGSLAAYSRVYAQRIDAHAQWEVQEYAKAMGELIEPLFPVSWKALSGTAK
jgi:thymidylate synthase (FAD)